jgi:hypothetical protein
MLMEEQVHPEQLIDRVTTLKAAPLPDLMKWNGFSSSLIQGIKASLTQIKVNLQFCVNIKITEVSILCLVLCSSEKITCSSSLKCQAKIALFELYCHILVSLLIYFTFLLTSNN